ncbi:MAG: hypothetical protein HY220_04295 [Candidatus Sungbacteria bacterium]|uniref:PEGA domain-containing protein n=1 Tax=Candidatus Sungiibacteriota bacterium TaxID=2750080 RepID=A0A9D6LP63_9BACT|nr:hypothetical protein [Candidatus Sungbacteria bacterium]
MRKTTRRAVFYLFSGLFLITTPLIVFYAFGYSFDFQNGVVVPTGGVFVKANVGAIRVLANGKLMKETNFLTKGALISGLSSGHVEVEVAKDGYIPWRKPVGIEEQVIQEYRSILLVPEALPADLVYGTTSQASSRQTVSLELLPDPTGNFIFWAAKKRNLTRLRVISRDGVETRAQISLEPGESYLSASWNPSGNVVLVSTNRRGHTIWRALSANSKSVLPVFDEKTILRTSTSTRSETISEASLSLITWSPADIDEFLVLANGAIYRWNLSSGLVKKIISSARSFARFNGNILYSTQSGFIATADLSGEHIESLDHPGLYVAKSPLRYFQNKDGVLALIDSAGGLYLENPSTRKFSPLTTEIHEAEFSSNTAELGYTQSGTFSTIALADETTQPFRRMYTKSAIFTTDEILHFIWLGNPAAHIVYTTARGVFLAETDPRPGANIVPLRRGDYQIVESPNDPNSFYFSDGEIIERLTIR